MMDKDNNIVSRSIYYYDLLAVIRKGSKITEEKEAILRSFERIRKLYEDFLDAKRKGDETLAKKLLNAVHYITEKGDYLYVLVDEIVDYKIKFRLVRTRTNAYPYIDINGELEKITTKIKGEFDVAEVTHCVIFADKNIMGAEYNSAGARATSLSVLFDERDYEVESLKVLNRIDKKAINKLQENKKYKMFQLTIKNSPEIIKKLRDKNLLGAAFGDFEFDTYTITIKRRITKNKSGFIPPFGVEEIEDLLKNNGDEIKSFTVDQGMYTKEVNLLSEKMMVKTDFEYDKDERILDSAQVYNKIENSAVKILIESDGNEE
jgi:hypothetical protein